MISSVHSKTLVFKKKAKNIEGTSVEDEIERSKVHWSELTEHTNDDKEVAEVNNVEVFQSLQRLPICGRFFQTFGDGGVYDAGELEMGRKFAEGGQAELYHTRVTWKNPQSNYEDQKHGFMYVLKVFRKGTFLRDLKKQWPEGLFRHYEDNLERYKLGKPLPIKYTYGIECGTLLPDGRFAFLLVRETEDLRTLIDRNMKARTCSNSGPFAMKMSLRIMYRVARGMDRLHNLGIVHRDLKASNVLSTLFNKNADKGAYSFYVADFECSIGVIGTGFFRAPEILQAVKDKVVHKRPDLFTKASDVYSYGMVCYEILTGKLPLEGYDFDLVLNGHQPEMPHYVDEWLCDLLQRCWKFDSTARPTIREILKILEDNSEVCEGLKQQIEHREMMPLEQINNLFLKYEF